MMSLQKVQIPPSHAIGRYLTRSTRDKEKKKINEEKLFPLARNVCGIIRFVTPKDR